MAAAFHQHGALALEDDGPVLLGAPVFETHDAGILTISVALFEHLAVGVDGVAVENRRAKTNSVEREFGQRILRGVLRGQPDAYGTGNEAEYQALPEGRLLHAIFIVMSVGAVEHQLGEHLVLDFTDRGAARMTKLRADLEIFEVVSAPGYF